MDFFPELTSAIDRALLRFLATQRDEVCAADPAALPIADDLIRVVKAGGKRLRPLFCYWGFKAFQTFQSDADGLDRSDADGMDETAIVHAAGSLELLHTFAIIHDDVMDRSPLRRGIPASYRALGDGHFGIAAAILAGDLAFVLADRMLMETSFEPVRLADAFAWFTRMRLEVVAGQYADLAAARDRGADEPAARRIAAMKSGAYTVEKPLAIGAALAGAGPEAIERLGAFGRPLGEAFQLRDDVLGAFGEPAITGKDADADLREGKATVLVAKTRALATPEDRAFFDDRLGSPDLTSLEVERLRGVMRRSGALAGTLALIDQLSQEALEALDAASVPADAHAALSTLARYAVERDE